MSDRTNCRHNSLVIRTQRGVIYKRKQQVGWLANTGYDHFLPVRQMAPRGVHITSKFSHETSACRAPMPTITVISQLHYQISWVPWWGEAARRLPPPDTSGHFLVVQYLDLFSSSAWDWNLLLPFTTRTVNYCTLRHSATLLSPTVWMKKQTLFSCPYLCQILIDFRSSFTGALSGKFATKRSAQTSLHFECVATLPCEILMPEYYSVTCALEHCLAERWIRQRPDVWQATIVVTEASYNNRLHWPSLQDLARTWPNWDRDNAPVRTWNVGHQLDFEQIQLLNILFGFIIHISSQRTDDN